MIVIEGVSDVSREDSGMALILEVYERGTLPFVRIQSYDEVDVDTEPRHPELEPLIGHKLRVTIEVVE